VNDIDEDAWERRRRSFERTAEEYDRWRPSYPDALFDEVRAYADLAPDDAILEIGAGTGRATRLVASWGNPLLAIEPAPAMADVARRNLVNFPNVEVRTTRIEDADAVGTGAFGLVYCAQAFHWLDPSTRAQRLHDALYHYGTAAIVANEQVTPDETLPFFVRVQEIYDAVAPDIAHKGEFRKPDAHIPHPLAGLDLFTDLEQRMHRWEWTLDTQSYVALLQTHSPHASLPSDVRARLVDVIADVAETEFGGSVTEHYIAVAALARRA
jgi:SAM-dependent methyltransferase